MENNIPEQTTQTGTPVSEQVNFGEMAENLERKSGSAEHKPGLIDLDEQVPSISEESVKGVRSVVGVKPAKTKPEAS